MRNEYSVACFGYAYEPISLVFVDTVYSSTYIIQLPFAMTSIGSCLLLYFGRSSLSHQPEAQRTNRKKISAPARAPHTVKKSREYCIYSIHLRAQSRLLRSYGMVRIRRRHHHCFVVSDRRTDRSILEHTNS